jgi:hypothetical protein
MVRNLHETIADEAWGRAQFSIGAAITAMAHGGYGYGMWNPIKTVLEYAGLSGDPAVLAHSGLKFPSNLRNPVLLDNAILRAIQFKAPFNPDRDVHGNGGEDVGLVDFVRLSFFLFGFTVTSFYLTYFALVSLSAAAAVVGFRKQPGLLAVFSVIALALALIFMSSVFEPEVIGILDPRFLSTLAIIPGLHIALVLLWREESSAANVALVLVQCGVLVFAYWIRTTVLWVVLALLVLALALVVREFRKSGSGDFRRFWPLGIFGALAVLHFVVVTVALHPVYRTANERPHHGLWHPLLYAQQAHSQWKTKYMSRFDGAKGDELPEVMAKKYLLRHPPSDPGTVYLDPDRKHIRTGVAETYKKRAFLEFFASDPRHVLESFFIYNPWLTLKALWFHLSFFERLPVAWGVAAAMIVVLAGLLLRAGEERARFRNGMLLCTGAFVLSFPYLFLTAPGYAVVTDQLLLLLALLTGWGAIVLAWATRSIFPKLLKASGSHQH